MKKWYMILFGALAVLMLALPVTAQDAKSPDEICQDAIAAATDPDTRQFTQAEQVVQPGVDYRAIFCTAVGPVYVDLLENETPVTVNNFVFLAQNGYYNHTTFHRVIENFMAQGGDPKGDGTGGPGYEFKNEPVPALNFDAPGLLAMANAGPDTNGSQFFITTVPYPSLNQSYTIFGKVLKGQANVEAIKLRDPATATELGTSLETVVIITDSAVVALPADAEPLTSAEVQTEMDKVSSIITPDVESVLEAKTAVFTTQEEVDSAPEVARENLNDFLTSHNHNFRVMGTINNKACDLQNIQFMSASYTLDAFATPEDAAAALADENFAKLPTQFGFAEGEHSDNLSQPLFKQTITACDQEALDALTYWQRGRFIATVEIVLPTSNPNTSTAIDRILSEFVGQQLFEPVLSGVLYRDIR
jgi:cyclophilin family peptidyl-prolyl cis-trans isomerase